MKKTFSLLIVVALIISLTSCKINDYKKATELFDSEKYSEALSLFEELGDYKDSADMVLKCKYEMALEYLEDDNFDSAKELLEELDDYEDCPELLESLPWKTFYAYLKENKSVEIKNDDPEYIVTLTTKGDNILASYVSDSDEVELSIELTVELSENATKNKLTGKGYMSLFSAYISDEGSTMWDTDSYKIGDTVTWTDYECTGRKVDGSPLDADAVGLCDNPKASLERLTAGIKQALEDSGLEVEMADVGFGNY